MSTSAPFADAIKILGKLADDQRNWSASQAMLPQLFEEAKRAELAISEHDARKASLREQIAALESQRQEQERLTQEAIEATNAAKAKLDAMKAAAEAEDRTYAKRKADLDGEIARKQETLARIESELAAARARLGL